LWKESFEKSSYFVHSMMKRKSSVVVTDFTEKKDCGIESNGKKVVIQNRITEYFRDVGIKMDDKEESRMHEILNEKKKHIVVNNSVVINDSFQLHENNKRVVINLVSDSSDDEEQKEKNNEKIDGGLGFTIMSTSTNDKSTNDKVHVQKKDVVLSSSSVSSSSCVSMDSGILKGVTIAQKAVGIYGKFVLLFLFCFCCLFVNELCLF